jgi:hypothetical protein
MIKKQAASGGFCIGDLYSAFFLFSVGTDFPDFGIEVSNDFTVADAGFSFFIPAGCTFYSVGFPVFLSECLIIGAIFEAWFCLWVCLLI